MLYATISTARSFPSTHSLRPLFVTADALRNPKLSSGICKGNPPNCDWLKLKEHYSASGAAAKEISFGCRAADSECYVQRNPDLLQGFCGGSLQGCDWYRIVEHWATVGQKEARVFACAPPASDPSPPPPPPPPPVWSDPSPPLPKDAVTPPTKLIAAPAVQAPVHVVASTVPAAAATGGQGTEIKVDVDSPAAAAPSLPLPSLTSFASQSYVPVLRAPEANKYDAEAPHAASGLNRLGSVSILLAGALVCLFAVARNRRSGEPPPPPLPLHMHSTYVYSHLATGPRHVDGSTELADDMDDFDGDSQLDDFFEDEEEPPPPSRKKSSKKSKGKYPH